MPRVPDISEVPELPEENSILALTHQLRIDVLQSMFGTDNKLPEDPGDRKTIVGILKDMDSQALGRMRIKVEEKANTNQEQAASIIAQVLQATGGHSPFRINKPLNREAPMLPNDIPPPVLVEGETSTMVSTTNFDEFMAKHGTNSTSIDE